MKVTIIEARVCDQDWLIEGRLIPDELVGHPVPGAMEIPFALWRVDADGTRIRSDPGADGLWRFTGPAATAPAETRLEIDLLKPNQTGTAHQCHRWQSIPLRFERGDGHLHIQISNNTGHISLGGYAAGPAPGEEDVASLSLQGNNETIRGAAGRATVLAENDGRIDLRLPDGSRRREQELDGRSWARKALAACGLAHLEDGREDLRLVAWPSTLQAGAQRLGQLRIGRSQHDPEADFCAFYGPLVKRAGVYDRADPNTRRCGAVSRCHLVMELSPDHRRITITCTGNAGARFEPFDQAAPPTSSPKAIGSNCLTQGDTAHWPAISVSGLRSRFSAMRGWFLA